MGGVEVVRLAPGIEGAAVAHPRAFAQAEVADAPQRHFPIGYSPRGEP
jgi:hypothetical protein